MARDKMNFHSRKPFQLDDIIIYYNLPWTIDVYYLTLWNHKRQDRIIRQNGYKRIRESASNPLVELKLWFEYKYHCIYVLESYIYSEQRQKEREERIRKVPFLLGNI